MIPARPQKLLLISYLFPPAGGVAVQRALSLAKYLPDCGLEVHVLRAWNAAAPVQDPGLLGHVPASVTIHDAFTPELPFGFRQKVWGWLSKGKGKAARAGVTKKPSQRSWKSWLTGLVRRVLCPEPEVLWVPFALRKARRIVRKLGIDTVLVTAPPFSAFLVGNALKREFPQLKLISDFRDSWLDFYLKTFDYQNSDYTRRRSAEIERATVENSEYVVTVTKSILDELRSRYAGQADEKFVLIPNGYDPQVFAGFQARRHATSKIVVTHLGTVYGASSPRYFLDALEEMPDEIRSAFEIRFIGRIADEERCSLESRKTNVRVLGFMPQSEALRHLEETDFALLVMTDPASLTGKLFEYLATGKPILAVASAGGEVARVLRETGWQWCAEPGDAPGLREMIRQAYQKARAGSNGFKPNWEAIRRYERPRLAAQFAALMTQGEAKFTKVEVM